MIRKHIFPNRAPAENRFILRGGEIRRIETLSDGVFAFAVTLLTVSLEVPKSFEELLISMRGFVAFGICFTLLMLVWFEQHLFFRRYGLDDRRTIFLNTALLFIVLFYVYPLKFLFTLVFSNEIYGRGKSPISISEVEVARLMIIYSVGYIIIYVIFLLLYLHARSKRSLLELSRYEIFDTNTKIYTYIILISIGLCSILLALTLPHGIAGTSGMFYMVIGPAFWVFYGKRGAMRRRLPGG